MANDLVNMADQFRGLPMKDLIGGPIIAATEAQTTLARAQAQFIDEIGLVTDAKGNKQARTVEFSMSRPNTQSDGTIVQEDVVIQAPFLAMVNVPALGVKNITVDFEMEVKSSFSTTEKQDMAASMDASAQIGWGPISATVKIHGEVSSHKETTRQSDNRAKYTVHVEARDDGMPEGLSRLLDILNDAVAPKQVTPAAAPADSTSKAKK